jgi:L-histidine N-alpha-methyltransferase
VTRSSLSAERDEPRLEIADLESASLRDDFGSSVREGLSAPRKRLECSWFYDAEGSRIFEEICATPEYYLTRAEDEILAANVTEMCAGVFAGSVPDADLVELGSGSGAKTRRVIAELTRTRGRVRYVPIDISRSALADSASRLLREFPQLSISAIAAPYERGLEALRDVSPGPKLVLWLGSNIGNFDRDDAVAFLERLRSSLTETCRLLVGFDLRKDRRTLERAYDDRAGVTARFNLNLLARINRELGGTFDLSRFAHRAQYDEVEGRIDMFLDSRVRQTVAIRSLEIEVDFEAGEPIHTESSYKHSVSELESVAARAGFVVERCWFDAARRFCEARMVRS